MDSADVVVIGAGLAGLQCARLLARAGWRVVLVDRKRTPDQFVHTTGIFVRRTFEEFGFPAGTLGRGIRRVTVQSPSGRQVTFESERDEFRIGRMKPLYRAMLEDAIAAGAEFAGGLSFDRIDFGWDRSHVWLRDRSSVRRINARFVIGADGASSRVARSLGLASPKSFLVGVEEVFHLRRPDTAPQLRCFLDPALALGYIGWIADDGDELHAGAAGEEGRFDGTRALSRLRQLVTEYLGRSPGEACERRGGRIPVGGIEREIATKRGLLVGDAAGAVSPLTAGGLDAALRLSSFAAQSLDRACRGAKLDEIYSGERFRTRFVSRLGMRTLYGLLGARAMNAAVFLSGSAPFRSFGEKLFFGHGSFPISAEELKDEFRTVAAPALPV